MHKLKIFLGFFVLLSIFSVPVFALETPGLKETFTIQTGGYEFDVKITSSFNVKDYEFSAEEKRLTFFLTTGIEENLSEIVIPTNLINGNFTFYLNDEEIFPKVLT
ncbi:MAG: hypothetical protein R3230_05340, partial [Nitrosopumilaceae archaeon]|nr:hypothetical protein [Nitrosopumilaceae archaeon]